MGEAKARVGDGKMLAWERVVEASVIEPSRRAQAGVMREQERVLGLVLVRDSEKVGEPGWVGSKCSGPNTLNQLAIRE